MSTLRPGCAGDEPLLWGTRIMIKEAQGQRPGPLFRRLRSTVAQFSTSVALLGDGRFRFAAADQNRIGFNAVARRPNTIQQDGGFHRRIRGSPPEASLSSERLLCTNEPMNAPSVSFVKSRNPLTPSMARAEKKIVRLAVASGKPVKPNLTAAPVVPERLLNLTY
jgi:hypothetical protein